MAGVPPVVSVIIPVHNRERVIGRAVRSALEQSLRDLEVLVVDDRSTDNTVSVVEQIDDERVRLLRMPDNVGPAGARNRGLEEASGAYISFLDSDDEWLPGKLQDQLERLGRDPGAGLAYGPYLISANARVARHDVELPEGSVFDRMMEGWSGPLPSTVTVERGLLEGEGFDDTLYGLEDYDLWLRLSQRTSFVASQRPVAIIDKSSGGRVTLSGGRRSEGIERLREKWRASMDSAGRGSDWTARCDQLELVTRLSGIKIEGGLGHRVTLAKRTLTAPVPRRTKLAGLLRLVVGPAVASRVQDVWFRLVGVRRERVRTR